ncbi:MULTISPECIES: zinc ribbon domain-containing protein [Caproicibacterium]|uniref:Zinc ribbon domain-containing protein n=1 Tax=Caproicibacterium argilliputei TaxID=3030016 RepID=A0AA97D9E2_9FIRM|nr:zinc ribbon domain-containing protein [Caproicibacterium argilliputei]WOC33020.1 zinc ribbon domain-containing protein [Caproicibacterium argilliputei]
MKCPKCGFEAGEAKFCPECGEKLKGPDEKRNTVIASFISKHKFPIIITCAIIVTVAISLSLNQTIKPAVSSAPTLQSSVDPATDYKPLTSGKFYEAIKKLNESWSSDEDMKGAAATPYINGKNRIEVSFNPSSSATSDFDRVQMASQFVSLSYLITTNISDYPELSDGIYMEMRGHARIAIMITTATGQITTIPTHEDSDAELNEAFKAAYDTKFSAYNLDY